MNSIETNIIAQINKLKSTDISQYDGSTKYWVSQKIQFSPSHDLLRGRRGTLTICLRFCMQGSSIYPWIFRVPYCLTPLHHPLYGNPCSTLTPHHVTTTNSSKEERKRCKKYKKSNKQYSSGQQPNKEEIAPLSQRG